MATLTEINAYNPVRDSFTAINDNFVALNAELGTLRECLTASRIYYVRMDGNDSNNGLADTSAGAFRTIQKAVNVVCETLDTKTYQVTIQVRPGTYVEAVSLKPSFGALPPALSGYTSRPSDVVISPSSGACVTCQPGSDWVLRGVSVGQPGGHGIFVNNANLEVHGVRLTTSSIGIYGAFGSYIYLRTGNICDGAFSTAVVSPRYSCIVFLAGTFDAQTSTFAYFLDARHVSFVRVHPTTFSASGSATGSRYFVTSNSAVVEAVSTTRLPGSTAGATTNGGQYFL
jgi:hypothetical protein